MCFAGAAVFGYMALVAANDRYGQEGAAILSTVYALTLCVSGVVFAAICKIVSSLSSINDNLSLLVKQTPKSDTKGLKETDSGSR